MNLHWLDLTTLIIYFAGVAGIGFYFSKKNTTTEDYFVGGRSFPGWAIGLSMVGTSISSISFLAYPADAYKTAWLRFLPNLTLPIAIVIAAYVFLPFFRYKKTTTAYEYLENRFGSSIRSYGAIAFLIAQFARISIILYLLSLVLQEITGYSSSTCIIIAGVFVGFYTIAGGINAVIWTDVIQTIVLVLGGVVCLGIIVYNLPEGFSQIFSIASEHNKFDFAEYVNNKPQNVLWTFSLWKKTGLMMLFIGLTNWLTEYSSNQNVVQRYCASKSSKEAKKAMFICVGSSIPIWAFFMFLGTALFVFFKVHPNETATVILNGVNGHKAEEIMPFFIMKFLPPGVAGLVIAAALAAAMSSLDSSINAISTVGVTDIYKRHLNKEKNDKHYLKVAWAFACVASLFMIIGAVVLANSKTKTLQDASTTINAVLGGGLLAIYLLGFLTRRGNAKAIWIGIVSTIAFTIWAICSKGMYNEDKILDAYYTGVIGNLVMFITAFIASFIFSNKDKDLTNLTIFDRTK